jgi:hypothetical protein
VVPIRLYGPASGWDVGTGNKVRIAAVNKDINKNTKTLATCPPIYNLGAFLKWFIKNEIENNTTTYKAHTLQLARYSLVDTNCQLIQATDSQPNTLDAVPCSRTKMPLTTAKSTASQLNKSGPMFSTMQIKSWYCNIMTTATLEGTLTDSSKASVECLIKPRQRQTPHHNLSSSSPRADNS